MTPTFCCGWECGRLGSVGEHWGAGTGVSVSTTTVRSGARSLRTNPSASTANTFVGPTVIGTAVSVFRFYVYFTTLPSADCNIAYIPSGNQPGLAFKQSDGKLYCAQGTTPAFGATGVSVTTGVWYRIDLKIDQNSGSGTGTIDAQVDGAALGQKTWTVTSSSTAFRLGCSQTVSGDWFYDDIVMSTTSANYPIGAGFVNHFVPTADGTHNIAGTGDFKHTAGTDILNATTDAYTLIDDVPLKATTPTEYVNMLLPVNATDYVECIFGPAAGISTPTAGPRAVEVIALVAQAGTGAGNMEVRLNDNGSMGTIYTATGVAGIVAGKYVRAHFADPPSAATVWNAANDGGNGDFRDLRVRCGSPAALDVNPDQYFASLMIEAEFAAPVTAVLTGTITPSATEVDIVAGGKTLIITLTEDTWIAAGAASFDLQRDEIIAGCDSAQSETFGWDLVPKAAQSLGGVVRTSDTIVTITWDAFGTYSITANETITVTIPGTALTGGNSIVATPTFIVSSDVTTRIKDIIGGGIIPWKR